MKKIILRTLLVYISAFGLAVLTTCNYGYRMVFRFAFTCSIVSTLFFLAGIILGKKSVLGRNLCFSLCILAVPVLRVFLLPSGLLFKDALTIALLSVLSLFAMLSIPSSLLPYLGRMKTSRQRIVDYLLVLITIVVIAAPFFAVTSMSGRYTGEVIPAKEPLTIVLEPLVVSDP